MQKGVVLITLVMQRAAFMLADAFFAAFVPLRARLTVSLSIILAKILTAAFSIVNYRRSYAAARVQLRDWMISGR